MGVIVCYEIAYQLEQRDTMASGFISDEFTGGAFHTSFDKGKASGILRVSGDAVVFSNDQASVRLPLRDLLIKPGGANNRLIFLSSNVEPEWSVYTPDRKILQHHQLIYHPTIGPQLSRIRGGRRIQWLITAAVVMLIPAVLGLLAVFKDSLVNVAAAQVPPEWEQKLGDTAFAQISLGNKFIDDEETVKALDAMTAALLAVIPDKRYPFKFHIQEDAALNAFAIPGGNVVLHTGLLLAAESPEEVLGVVAHEIAHVTEQHSVRQMIATAGLFVIVQAVFGDVSGLVAIAADSGRFLMSQKFSRDHERDADNVGWQYMLAAQIDPVGMIRIFQRLENEQKTLQKIQETIDFLNTHPATADRIAAMQEKQKALAGGQTFKAVAMDFAGFQDRIRRQLGSETAKEAETAAE
tara:strand:+ start:2018 stop:3244 length:1227 start_codon:yes stop_codon:yes gene_type:complete